RFHLACYAIIVIRTSEYRCCRILEFTTVLLLEPVITDPISLFFQPLRIYARAFCRGYTCSFPFRSFNPFLVKETTLTGRRAQQDDSAFRDRQNGTQTEIQFIRNPAGFITDQKIDRAESSNRLFS